MRKTRLLLISLLVLILIIIFPQKVSAYDPDIYKMFYYDLSFSNDGSEDIRVLSEDFEFIGDFSMEDKAYVIYTNLFSIKNARFLPEGAEVLSVRIEEDELFLNVTKEIHNIKGSAAQTYMLGQLLRNADQFGVSSFTLLTEGQTICLSEGIIPADISTEKEIER